ncbi:MAG: hypothetical protein ACO386_08360, partial [Burkholderiaceae bacterium]
MSSLNKSGSLDRFAWWFPLIFAAVISLWVFFQRPLSTQVRELAMAQAALAVFQPSGAPVHRLSPGAAQRLCEMVGSQALQRLDCRTGLSLDAPVGGPASADARVLLSAGAGLDG